MKHLDIYRGAIKHLYVSLRPNCHVLIIFRVDDQNLGDTGGNNKTKKIVIPVVVSVSVLVILIAFTLFWKLRRNERSGTSCFVDM